MLFSGSLGTTASPSGSAASEQILLLVVVVSFVAFAYDGRIGIDLFIIVCVFSAVPQAIAVILIYGPATVFIFVIVVGTLAATEATDFIRVVVICKTQWLH